MLNITSVVQEVGFFPSFCLIRSSDNVVLILRKNIDGWNNADRYLHIALYLVNFGLNI